MFSIHSNWFVSPNFCLSWILSYAIRAKSRVSLAAELLAWDVWNMDRASLTSLTTLIVVAALFILGGPVIHNFAFALIIGVVVGTYSSIYVAANILVLMKITREDLLIPEKEGLDAEEP